MLQHQSDSINEIATALAKAQGAIRNPKKDSINPFLKNNYASLNSVLEVCRFLSDFDIAFTQTIMVEGEKTFLVTSLFHSSGQYLRSMMPIICKDPTNPQGFGSSLSYARRYSLMSFIGLVGENEDDDAEKGKQVPITISIDQALEISEMIGEDKELRNKITEAIRKETCYPKAAISDMPAHRLKMYLSSIDQWKKKKESEKESENA